MIMIKIKFDSDEELPSNKIIVILIVTIVVNNKYNPQVFFR